MSETTQTDTELIEGIKAGGRTQEACIKLIYKQHLGFVHAGLQKYNLSKDELLDAYTDAVIALKTHVSKGVFRGESKVSTYLFQIFSNRCVDVIRKKTTQRRGDGYEFTYELPFHLRDRTSDIARILNIRESFDQLMGYIRQLGETCQRVLIDKGYWGYKDAEIAVRAGLSNEKVVRSKRHTCMKQLMKILEKAGYPETN